MPSLIDLTGRRFSRWLVLSRAPGLPGQTSWSCVCDCGVRRGVRGCHLKSGASGSCGCLNAEVRITAHTKHGETPLGARLPAEYRVWQGMKARCYNARSQDFEAYGGRGIIVCPAWRNDYAAFVRDMGRRPSPAHSIDRIKVNGNYEPGNCRWATAAQQAWNTRRNKLSLPAIWVIRNAAADGVPRKAIATQFGLSKGYLNRLLRVGLAA